MKLFRQVSGLLAFGLLVAACNTAPTPPSEPRFKLEPGVAALEISAGSEASSFVALNRNAGFNDTVQMTIQNLPAGFEQEWTRDSSNGDCGVQLKVGKNVAPGEYNLTVVGLTGVDAKAGSNVVSRAATVEVSTKLKVVVPDLSNTLPFSLTTSPSVFSAEPGFTAQFGVNIKQNKAGFEEDVQLSLQNLPLGVTASFARNPVRVLFGTSSTPVTLTIAANTLPGTYAMKLIGAAPSRSVPTVVQLTVLPANTQGFKLTATPSADPFMQESGSNIVQVKIERKAGFTGAISLSAQNVPANVQANISGTPLTGTNGNFDLSAGFAAQSGTFAFTLKGTSGAIVNTVPITVSLLSRFELPEASNTGLNALDSSFTNIPVPGFRIFPELKSPNVFFEGNNTSILQQFATLALPDGKVLTTAGFGDKVARLNSDGTLDSSFGINGVSPAITTASQASFGDIGFILGLARQTDGKILISGTLLDDGNGNGINTNFARLNANGSLDTSFGTGGVATIAVISDPLIAQEPLAFAQVDLGRILIITPKELIRLTAGGNLDPDFDTDGRKPISLPVVNNADAVGLTDSLGRFVIVTNATTNNVKQIRVFRVLQDGTLDPSYPNNGVTLNNMQLSGRGIALDSQNRVLLPVVATATTNPQPESLFRVIRLNASGILDTNFDTDGQAQVSFGAENQGARAVTVLSNNKIMVVGSARQTGNGTVATSDFAAMRLNENGSLDTSFGNAGKFLMGFKDPRVPAPTALNPNPELKGFTELFGAVVGLPNNGALAIGSGFGNALAGGGTFTVVGKLNP